MTNRNEGRWVFSERHARKLKETSSERVLPFIPTPHFSWAPFCLWPFLPLGFWYFCHLKAVTIQLQWESLTWSLLTCPLPWPDLKRGDSPNCPQRPWMEGWAGTRLTVQRPHRPVVCSPGVRAVPWPPPALPAALQRLLQEQPHHD